ncbi:hypothetical protein A2881_05515 [Candidatus Peribacteria bacterium RIFCSPHIGHO2_01_FULL_55_13]|nr:MAG: hypothetical protein A2881_05515 [Candidatus Peribacteria bacterium RIFCSPHIGHO2_01_FULL_55_13]
MLAGDVVDPPLLTVDQPEGELAIFAPAPNGYDINRDGAFSPVDVLILVNDLNTKGPRSVATLAPVANDAALEEINQGEEAQVDAAFYVDDVDCDVVQILAEARQGSANVLVEGDIVTITPDADFSGNLVIEYSAHDSDGSDTGTISVFVRPNQAPIANDLSFEIETGVPYVLDIPKIDLDPGQVVRIDIATQPAHGTLVANENGTFTYTSGEGFLGTDSFTYRASDGIAADFGTFTLTDPNFNHPPVAPDLSFDANAGETFIVDVPKIDVDGDTVTLSLESQPQDGSVAQNADGTFSYTSNATFSGTDSFTYRASDGMDSAVGMITFNVIGVSSVADFGVTLSGSNQATDNAQVEYSAIVTNNGPDAASVTLRDAGPAGLTFVSTNSTVCTYDTNVSCTFELAAGTTRETVITYSVNDDTSETLGNVVNQASVVTTANDANTGNNVSSAVQTTVSNDQVQNQSPVDSAPESSYDGNVGVELFIPNTRFSDPDGDVLRCTILYPDSDLAVNVNSQCDLTVTPIAGETPRTDVIIVRVEDLRDLDGDGVLEVLSTLDARFWFQIFA